MKPSHDMFSFISKVEALTAQLNDKGKVTTKNAIITKIICALLVEDINVATTWDAYPEKQ
jgi:hypothetical protein